MRLVILRTSLKETFEGIFTRGDFKQILLILFNGFDQFFFDFKIIIKSLKNFFKGFNLLEFSTHQIWQKGKIIDLKVIFKRFNARFYSVIVTEEQQWRVLVYIFAETGFFVLS